MCGRPRRRACRQSARSGVSKITDYFVMKEAPLLASFTPKVLLVQMQRDAQDVGGGLKYMEHSGLLI